jgi:hypothetical protein
MKYAIVITTLAYYDLEDAISYYESKLNGLGRRMEGDFWKSVDVIQKSPLGYRLRYVFYRQTMLQKFPYAIIYEVLNEKIIIYRVAHLKIRPEKRFKI